MNGGPKGGHNDWVALVVGCGLRMNGRFAPTSGHSITVILRQALAK
jgi:hypothetical protein